MDSLLFDFVGNQEMDAFYINQIQKMFKTLLFVPNFFEPLSQDKQKYVLSPLSWRVDTSSGNLRQLFSDVDLQLATRTILALFPTHLAVVFKIKGKDAKHENVVIIDIQNQTFTYFEPNLVSQENAFLYPEEFDNTFCDLLEKRMFSCFKHIFHSLTLLPKPENFGHEMRLERDQVKRLHEPAIGWCSLICKTFIVKTLEKATKKDRCESNFGCAMTLMRNILTNPLFPDLVTVLASKNLSKKRTEELVSQIIAFG